LSNEAYRYANARVRNSMDIINSVDDAQETIEDLNEVANQRDEILDNISDTFERLQVAQSRYQDLIFSPRRGQVVFWGVRNPDFPGGTQNLPNGSVQVPIQFNQVHHNFGVWN